MCRLSLGSQWGAPTGHIGCMLKSPPATGRPGWRSGNARARCTGLRTSLDGCAAHPQCSRGWCCARSTPQPSAQTAGAASTIATGRRRVAGCDAHVSHICARALAAQRHVHAIPSLLQSFIDFYCQKRICQKNLRFLGSVSLRTFENYCYCCFHFARFCFRRFQSLVYIKLMPP